MLMTMKIAPNITKAVNLLRGGGLVAFPTETVYGLGADAANEAAVRKIFHAKERPYDHPLIVHVAALDQLKDWARDISPAALKLARAFWPGSLTLVLKKQSHVLNIITGGQDTIGLRVPRHPMAQTLLQAFRGGIAAPSANKFTHISPTHAAAVREELGSSVDFILDGGACEVGLESTIIDMSGHQPVILRPGMITAQAIASVLGSPVSSSRQDTPHDSPSPRTPGMHHLHYAPTTKTILIEAAKIPGFLQTLKPSALPIAFVIRTEISLPRIDKLHWDKIHCVLMPRDAASYAHDLYHMLRLLDHQHFKGIVIETPPEGADWEAIRDRLFKASSVRKLCPRKV